MNTYAPFEKFGDEEYRLKVQNGTLIYETRTVCNLSFFPKKENGNYVNFEEEIDPNPEFSLHFSEDINERPSKLSELYHLIDPYLINIKKAAEQLQEINGIKGLLKIVTKREIELQSLKRPKKA